MIHGIEKKGTFSLLSVCCRSDSRFQSHVDLDLCLDCNAYHLCDLVQEACSWSFNVPVGRIAVVAPIIGGTVILMFQCEMQP